jgi:hypothetical protein
MHLKGQLQTSKERYFAIVQMPVVTVQQNVSAAQISRAVENLPFSSEIALRAK